MNAAHFHLIVNHFPVIFPIAGILLMITGYLSKSIAVRQAAYLLFILASISTIAAMVSGEGAEETVEGVRGVSENLIERHEDSAKVFSIMTYILGGISLLGIWASYRQKSIASIANLVTLIFAFVVVYFGKEAGTTGGEIMHSEIRSGVAVQPSIMDIRTDEDD